MSFEKSSDQSAFCRVLDEFVIDDHVTLYEMFKESDIFTILIQSEKIDVLDDTSPGWETYLDDDMVRIQLRVLRSMLIIVLEKLLVHRTGDLREQKKLFLQQESYLKEMFVQDCMAWFVEDEQVATRIAAAAAAASHDGGAVVPKHLCILERAKAVFGLLASDFMKKMVLSVLRIGKGDVIVETVLGVYASPLAL